MAYQARSLLQFFISVIFVGATVFPVWGATYPWEKDAGGHVQKKQEIQPPRQTPKKTEPAVSGRPTFKLGPFIVDQFKGWRFEKDSDGDTIRLRDGGGAVKSAIQVDNYSIKSSNYQKSTQSVLNNFSYDVKKSIPFAGRDNVLYLRDTGEGVTQVNIFPYADGRIYRVYVFIRGEYNGVTKSVKKVLDSFRFAD